MITNQLSQDDLKLLQKYAECSRNSETASKLNDLGVMLVAEQQKPDTRIDNTFLERKASMIKIINFSNEDIWDIALDELK